MATAVPSRPEPSAASTRSLRLLERRPAPPRSQPMPVTWQTRLGRWVDRLLTA